MNSYVYFLGERSDVPNIMKALDVLVIPSDNESLGLVAIEAISSGLPLISTPNDGVSEVLDSNPDYIASSNDSLGLYKLMKQYLEDQVVLPKRKDEILKYQERYDVKRIASLFESILSGEK